MSTQHLAKPLAIAFLMLVAAGLTVAATPTKRMADEGPKVDLEQMIPESLEGWRIDRSIVPILPAPDVQAKLDQIYNQTLARTFISTSGQRVMLSIAYGGDQSDSMQLHRPEVCYAAQGFDVSGGVNGEIVTKHGSLPVKRLIARQGNRNEPITYWVVVGEKAILSGLRQKFAQLSYGLTGKVPDGFLVRVSSIDQDLPRAYRLQEEFIIAMLGAMGEMNRVRIAGRFGAGV